MTVEITLVESIAPKGGGKKVGKRWRARIIQSNVWGSSAYYPAEVLERDGARVFTPGLPMYADHPTDSESYDRPERSVRDLVGKIVSEAQFEEDGLYADVEFYDSFVDRINELHEDVGLSVRATGLTEEAERDGRFGPVLVGLLKADSVDVVTQAGAGGKLTSILESDLGTAGQPINRKETQSMTDVTKEDFEAFATKLQESIAALGTTLTESITSAVQPAAAVTSDEVVTETAEEKAEREKAEAEKVEAEKETQVDTAAIAEAVIDAQLDKSALRIVEAAVKGGATIEDAVAAIAVNHETGVSSLKENGGVPTTGLARAVAILG